DVPQAITSSVPTVVTSTLVITDGPFMITDVDVVALTGTHTYIGDLEFALQSPTGTRVQIMARSCDFEENFDINLDDEAAPGSWPCPPDDGGVYRPSNPLSAFDGQDSNGTWSLVVTDYAFGDGGSLESWGLRFNGEAPVTGDYRPAQSLSSLRGAPLATPLTLVITDYVAGQAGTLDEWTLKSVGSQHTYTWDTFASGFFGQSDNVVLRLEAYPVPSQGDQSGTYRYTNQTPGPYQRPYASAHTFPFRVQGTQVRVYSETVKAGHEVAGAMVYRLPAGQVRGGDPMADSSGDPLRTDHRGYLQGRGQINSGDQLVALLPVHEALDYADVLELDGVDDYVSVNPLHNAPITETTVSFWMRSNDASGKGTPLSYATPGDDAELLITDYNDFTVHRGRSISVSTGISATDGAWHHIAVTWRDADDQLVLYKDGVAAFTGTLAAAPITTTSGSLALGKDQGGGDFFQGSLDQVCVWNTVLTETQVQAEDLRFPQGDEAGLVASWSFDQPTDNIALDQSANGNDGTLVGATWAGDSLGGYTVYHISAAPTDTGLDMFSVSEAGVQVLTVTAAHPLALFDLNVSLEWDARQDTQFLSQLEYDLKRASEFLFDWSDGQAALGQLTLYHDREKWSSAHVRVYANNRLRPNAIMGGFVSRVVTDPLTSTLTYAPGQLRMASTWNRHGDASGNLGQDWPRTLAHELGHYVFFLDDDYLGLDENGMLVPVDTCTGTAMSDPYRDDYSEFHPDAGWLPGCQDTLANHFTGRSDWATIHAFYPWLTATMPLTGPGALPLDVTQVQIVAPIASPTTLDVPIFYLSLAETGERVQPGPSAQAVLFQDGRLIDLGRANLDQITAWGARAGDRLCLYELAEERLGCETVTPGDNQLALVAQPGWQPEVLISPVSSRTVHISVTVGGVFPPLGARLYPENGPATQAITLTQVSTGYYSGTFDLGLVTMAGYVLVWVQELDPRREVVTNYALGGNPIPLHSRDIPLHSRDIPLHSRDIPLHSRDIPLHSRDIPLHSRDAPGVSADGQAILFGETLTFTAGTFFSLQAATV
ncbi:MAG: proprotein convertase P-domain-containing protein, partial [Anaerolineae bacterium]